MSWGGVKQQSIKVDIEAWCEEMEIENYIVNSQGEIDVEGDAWLNGRDFKELPYKFGKVNGYFSLAHNKNLTSLKNCPNEVSGSFDIDGCSQLSSLEGCPKKVGGYFWCRKCKIKFTKKEVLSLCKASNGINTT